MLSPTIPNPYVLVAEDEQAIGMLLRDMLKGVGYEVTLAGDGRQALELARQRTPDLILSDLDMPHLSGYELCRHLKADPATRLIPIVIITGQNAQAARLRAWDCGADDFLTKPFQSIEVLARCRSLLRVKALVNELDSAQTVVFSLARAIESKSTYTQGHSERVVNHAMRLAEHVGLPMEEREALRLGATLHDVGKIGIPDAILNKPGSLTTEELDIVKRHPVDGVRIVEPLRSLQTVLPLVRWHHERMDGGGYPDGLFGSALPLAVRILSVADVFDALASPRPYRDAIPAARCLEIMRENALSGGLDPELVLEFTQMMEGERTRTMAPVTT